MTPEAQQKIERLQHLIIDLSKDLTDITGIKISIDVTVKERDIFDNCPLPLNDEKAQKMEG